MVKAMQVMRQHNMRSQDGAWFLRLRSLVVGWPDAELCGVTALALVSVASSARQASAGPLRVKERKWDNLAPPSGAVCQLRFFFQKGAPWGLRVRLFRVLVCCWFHVCLLDPTGF